MEYRQIFLMALLIVGPLVTASAQGMRFSATLPQDGIQSGKDPLDRVVLASSESKHMVPGRSNKDDPPTAREFEVIDPPIFPSAVFKTGTRLICKEDAPCQIEPMKRQGIKRTEDSVKDAGINKKIEQTDK